VEKGSAYPGSDTLGVRDIDVGQLTACVHRSGIRRGAVPLDGKRWLNSTSACPGHRPVRRRLSVSKHLTEPGVDDRSSAIARTCKWTSSIEQGTATLTPLQAKQPAGGPARGGGRPFPVRATPARAVMADENGSAHSWQWPAWNSFHEANASGELHSREPGP